MSSSEAARCLPVLPALLVLTDRSQLPPGRSLVRTVAECVEAGLSHVVLRELDLSEARRAALVPALTRTGATVIAAHTLLPGAAGVHQSSTAQGHPQPPLGGSGAPGRLVGRSCHTGAEVVAAAADGCDYATLGPFAVTASKPGYGPPLAAHEYANLPIATYALGGLDARNAEEALAAGAFGVAVMGGVMRAASPGGVVRKLLAVLG